MTISAHILLAIKTIFVSNEGRLNIATGYLNQYSDNLGTLFPLLDDLCNCNFQTLAGLKNVIPTSSEASTINSALYAAGAAIPADAICGKVGTLGSFYSCTSISSTARTLIATGSELCAKKILAQQNCTNWAKSKAFYDYGNAKFDAISTVYASNSAGGSCFKVNGGMKTALRIINPGVAQFGSLIVPSLDITCSATSNICSTKATTIYSTSGASTTFPSLTVSCDATGNFCSTNSMTPAQAAANSVFTINGVLYPTSIPSLSVDFINPTAGSLSDLCQYYLDVA